MFTNSLRAAEKAGGMWLAHQDCGGDSAVQQGDLVCFAKIIQIDWLSQSQIVADCEIHHWAIIAEPNFSSPAQWPCPSLYAKAIQIWQRPSSPCQAESLQHALSMINQQHPELRVEALGGVQQADAISQLCWRWLELLPLPLKTKQRLLHAPSAELCARYLAFILRQNDRFNYLPR